jgi:hypothetical protein
MTSSREDLLNIEYCNIGSEIVRKAESFEMKFRSLQASGSTKHTNFSTRRASEVVMDLLSKSKDAVVDALTRATGEVAINKSKFNFAQSHYLWEEKASPGQL